MSLDLHYSQTGKKGKVSLEGDFTVYSLSKWKDFVLAKANEIDVLVADFSKVSQVDTAGIQILVSTKKFFSSNSKKFIIQNHCPKLIEYLDVYGLIGFMEDKIQISAQEKEKYSFRYGLKKLPKILKV